MRGSQNSKFKLQKHLQTKKRKKKPKALKKEIIGTSNIQGPLFPPWAHFLLKKKKVVLQPHHLTSEEVEGLVPNCLFFFVQMDVSQNRGGFTPQNGW